MSKKQGEFNAIIEGDENRRYVTRNFPAGSQPTVILGTAKGSIQVSAWETLDGDVHVRVIKARWGLGDGEPVNGVYETLYEGSVT